MFAYGFTNIQAILPCWTEWSFIGEMNKWKYQVY